MTETPNTPKPRPYAVAMLFGRGDNVNLGLGIVGAMDREHAGAFAVLTHVRENNISEPLVGMTIMEIEDSVVRMMFNNLKPGEVVNLRAVMPDAAVLVPAEPTSDEAVFPPPPDGGAA